MNVQVALNPPEGIYLEANNLPDGAAQHLLPDALAWDGSAYSGPDGSYTVWTITSAGVVGSARVEIVPVPVVTETSAAFEPPAGYSVITLTATTSDPQIPVGNAIGDQIWVPTDFAANDTWEVAEAPGTYSIYHVSEAGVVTGIEYTVASEEPVDPVEPEEPPGPSIATVKVSLLPEIDHNLAVLGGTIEPLLFDHWPRQPLAGEQLVVIEGSFDEHGNYTGGTEEVIPVWFIELDGTTHAFNIDATGLPVYEAPNLEVAETTATFSLGEDFITTTFVEPIEPYLFEHWLRQPVANEQISIDEMDGAFDQHGNLDTNVEGLITVYFTDADGVIHALQVDSAGLEVGEPGEGVVAPTLTLALSDVSADQGDTLTINLDGHFAGATGYSVSGLPAGTGLTLSGGTLSGTFTASDASASPFTVSVTAENSAGSVTDAFTATVAVSTVEIYNFTATSVAEAVVATGSLAKEITFGFETVAELVADVLLSNEYVPPVINMPNTELTAGYDNADADEINLFQGCWHKLIYPITINGEPIPYVLNAKLALFRGSDMELEVSLGQGIRFQGSTLYVELDETETINLIQGYSYELWILDTRNNPLFVRSGKISFKPTKVRF